LPTPLAKREEVALAIELSDDLPDRIPVVTRELEVVESFLGAEIEGII
jgi:hypothetical protein